VRIGDDGLLHCRKCGSPNMLVRSAEANTKRRHVRCADCDERQSWRPPKEAWT